MRASRACANEQENKVVSKEKSKHLISFADLAIHPDGKTEEKSRRLDMRYLIQTWYLAVRPEHDTAADKKVIYFKLVLKKRKQNEGFICSSRLAG